MRNSMLRLLLVSFVLSMFSGNAFAGPGHRDWNDNHRYDRKGWHDDHSWKQRRHRREYIVERDYRYVDVDRRVVINNYPKEVCSTTVSNQSGLGMVLGGVTGGVVGNQFGKGSGRTAATVGGVILGGILGNNIGTDFTTVDRNCTYRALREGPNGRRISWHNPDTDAYYDVVPIRSYTGERGAYCREYQSQANVGGRVQETFGTACLQPDGAWKIVR